MLNYKINYKKTWFQVANDSVIIYLFSPGFSKLLTHSLALAQTLVPVLLSVWLGRLFKNQVLEG